MERVNMDSLVPTSLKTRTANVTNPQGKNPLDHVSRVTSISNLKEKYGRIIVVSNRLPITIEKKDDGSWDYKMSSGGLVAGLEGVKKKMSFVWVGWPGKYFELEDQKHLQEVLQKDYNYIPVFLKDDLAEAYYNGFSNGVLWPLFHYLSEESGANFSEALWESYVKANAKFAEVILRMWRPGDLLWIHDFHLFKLPEVLRKKIPNIRIGFFLHIPFPSSEIFQVLPVRKAVLTGMLNCDLVGFHTYDYARHFLSSCTRMLGVETSPAGVYYGGRFVPVTINPVGIDPEKFAKQLDTPETKQKVEEYKKQFEGKKVLLGVDRLDYIKGIPHRLNALEVFFQKYPEWHNKVVLIQVAVPSRTDVEEYKKLKNEVDALVGHINGTYGSVNFNPINYLFKSVPFAELCALYRISDVGIVTSLRDGMNLVAQEYIACQTEGHGVLVLSEFAGSSSSLGSGAILVNPWNAEDVADSIYESINLTDSERQDKHSKLFRSVAMHTAGKWGETFIKELDRVARLAQAMDSTPKLTLSLIKPAYQKAQKRVLVFESDGGLIPFVSVPFLAAPSRRVTSLLAKLCQNPNNSVYVVSGRDRNTLLQWFGKLNLGIVAEHGFFFCDKVNTEAPNESNWETMEHNCDLSFKDAIRPVFQYFTDRTPGSFFEEKEASLTWHFRSTETTFGAFRAQELQCHLETSTFHAHVQVSEKTLEVRPHECNSTSVIRRILKKHPNNDFMLYVGEATSAELSDKHLFTCSVGKKHQKYWLNDCNEVLDIIAGLDEEETNRDSSS